MNWHRWDIKLQRCSYSSWPQDAATCASQKTTMLQYQSEKPSCSTSIQKHKCVYIFKSPTDTLIIPNTVINVDLVCWDQVALAAFLLLYLTTVTISATSPRNEEKHMKLTFGKVNQISVITHIYSPIKLA